ncbi:MAG: YraN family protein [Chloroflexi bacterium]|nr:YraN family protein [Chloroflexota bacterium]
MSSERPREGGANQRLGKAGEGAARRELSRMGYEILSANYRTREGEVDLIAREDGQFVFVEVKTRLGRSYGIGEEAITPAKQARIVKAAQAWLQEQGQAGAEWRIDIVVVEPGRLNVHRNAVAEPDP